MEQRSALYGADQKHRFSSSNLDDRSVLGNADEAANNNNGSNPSGIQMLERKQS